MNRVASSLRLTTARRKTVADEIIGSSQTEKSGDIKEQAKFFSSDEQSTGKQPETNHHCSPFNQVPRFMEQPKPTSPQHSHFSELKETKVAGHRSLLRNRPIFFKVPSNNESTVEDAGEKTKNHHAIQLEGSRVGTKTRADGPEALNRTILKFSEFGSSRDMLSNHQRQCEISKFCSSNTKGAETQDSKLNEILNRPIRKPVAISDEEMRYIISQVKPHKSILKNNRVLNIEPSNLRDSRMERPVVSAGRVTEPHSSSCKKVTFSKNKIVKIYRQPPSTWDTHRYGKRDN